MRVAQQPRLIAQDRRRDLVTRLAHERVAAVHQLVQQDPEGELIGAMIDIAAFQLFRRHVGERADGRPRRRECGDGLDLAPRRRRGLELGDAEVEDLDGPAGRHEDVLGFQIAVDDAGAVCGRECVRHRRCHLERLRPRQWPAGQAGAQGLALEQLGDEVDVPTLLPDVMDGQNAGMRQRRDGARLTRQPGDGVGIVAQMGREDLDRDVAPEPRVVRTIDLAHAARAEERDDPVRAEGRASRNHWPMSVGMIARRPVRGVARGRRRSRPGSRGPRPWIPSSRTRRPDSPEWRRPRRGVASAWRDSRWPPPRRRSP